MKKLFLGLFTIGMLFSCDKENDEININEQNFLVFGHFYGMCIGEECVETFKLTEKSLFEDTVDDYNGQNMVFVELEKNKFEQVKNLEDFFPNQLLKHSESVFGCPDCADGGGILVQYSENGNVKTWRIDQDKNRVPDFLHNFIDKINEKIALVNN